jgi:sporulation protein YlmC with PRC-barrel domain
MLKIKKISEALGKKVYTDEGDFFGEIEEVNLSGNKVDSWRIRIAAQTANLFNGARGVIIPHNFVKSVGDVFLVNTLAMPSQEMPELSDNENL